MGKTAEIAVFDDYRAVIDAKTTDAVICGTVDHWHVEIAAEALTSGKDVSCEKPLTPTVDEGRVISKVVEKTGCVTQVGTQQRSDERFLQAVALARSGRLGDGSIDASNCHKGFRWWLQYSGGTMADWGPHHVDIPQWIIDQCGPGQRPLALTPVMVQARVPFDADGNPTLDDRSSVPHRFTVHAEFLRGVLMQITSEGRTGILVEGTKRRFFVNRGPLVPHIQDFFDCIACRKKPASDVWTHMTAINTCHVGNIAIRLNRKIAWDAATQSIKDDPKASRMLARDYRKGYEIEL